MKYNDFCKLYYAIYSPLEEFKKNCLPLCAAENEQSEFSKIPLNSFIQDKYIMGGIENYLEDNNFIGSKNLFKIYELLQELCIKLFNVTYADGRPLTGVNTINLLLMSLFKVGDTIFISDEDYGGHSSMKKICARLGIKTIPLPYDYNILDFDYDKINSILNTKEIHGILICLSDMIFQPKLNKINLKENTILIYDATQVLGLIASGIIENYFNFFNNQQFIIAGSTHKTIPGPTNGLILTNSKKIIQKIDLKINPDYLRNVQLHQILSLIFTLEEFSIFGKDYMNFTVKTANILGFALEKKGFKIIKKGTQYTETHQLFISMEKDIVKKFVKKCNLYGVTLNERYKPIYGGSGVRLGVQLIARYKWQKKDIELFPVK